MSASDRALAERARSVARELRNPIGPNFVRAEDAAWLLEQLAERVAPISGPVVISIRAAGR